MCGSPGTQKQKHIPPLKEIACLTDLVRGIYVKSDFPASHVFQSDAFYLAIPLQKGQFSCLELMNGQLLRQAVGAAAPLRIYYIVGPHAESESLRQFIYKRRL